MAEARLIPPLYPLLPLISAENLISRPSPSPIDIRPRPLPSPPPASPTAPTPSPPRTPRRRRAQRAALPLRHERGRLRAWDGEDGGRAWTGEARTRPRLRPSRGIQALDPADPSQMLGASFPPSPAVSSSSSCRSPCCARPLSLAQGPIRRGWSCDDSSGTTPALEVRPSLGAVRAHGDNPHAADLRLPAPALRVSLSRVAHNSFATLSSLRAHVIAAVGHLM